LKIIERINYHVYNMYRALPSDSPQRERLNP